MSSFIFRAWRGLVRLIRMLIRGQRGLGDFTLDELQVERVRLEVAERRIVHDLERLEADKAALFEAAKHEPSMAIRQVQARKIRDIAHRIAIAQGNLKRIGKLLQVVDSLIASKEPGRLQAGATPVVGAILREDSQTLLDWVEEMAAGAVVLEEKVDSLIAAMEDAEQLRRQEVAEDAEIGAILAEIERAGAREAMAQESAFESPQPGQERPLREAERDERQGP